MSDTQTRIVGAVMLMPALALLIYAAVQQPERFGLIAAAFGVVALVFITAIGLVFLVHGKEDDK